MAGNNTLLEIRQQRLLERRDRLIEQRSDLIEQHRQATNAISQAAATGQHYDAQYQDEVAEGIEQEIQTLDLELARYEPQSGQITPAKVEFMRRYDPADLNRQHWSQIPGTSNLGALGYAHDRALQLGIPEDSKEYFDFVAKAGPEAEPALTANEVCKMTGVSPREYNRQQRIIDHQRKTGQRRD